MLGLVLDINLVWFIIKNSQDIYVHISKHSSIDYLIQKQFEYTINGLENLTKKVVLYESCRILWLVKKRVGESRFYCFSIFISNFDNRS